MTKNGTTSADHDLRALAARDRPTHLLAQRRGRFKRDIGLKREPPRLRLLSAEAGAAGPGHRGSTLTADPRGHPVIAARNRF